MPSFYAQRLLVHFELVTSSSICQLAVHKLLSVSEMGGTENLRNSDLEDHLLLAVCDCLFHLRWQNSCMLNMLSVHI
jgi:hypothetical protein